MNYKAVSCFLLLLGTTPGAIAQETKSFPDAKCSYTLAAKDWEWLDPELIQRPGGKTIVLAKSQKGIGFTLRFDHLKPGEKPNSRSYESFELGLLEAGHMKKLGGKHLSFRGIPSYQIDVKMPDGNGSSIRILYANNRFYHLQVVNAFGALDPDESEAVFEGFNFTSQPQAMLLANEDTDFRRGQQVGKAISILVVAGILSLVTVGTVIGIIFLIRNNNAKQARLRRKAPDY